MNNKGFERRTMRMITFGILLYAAVMNLDSVGNGLRYFLALMMPVLLGMGIALVLDVPMYAFEKLFARLDKRKKTSDGLRRGIALLLSSIAVPVILVVLLRFIVPQFISAVTNVIAIVRANEGKIGAFVSQLGMNPQTVTGKINEAINWVSSNLDVIAGTALNTVVTMFSSVTDVILAVIMAIYILADKAALKRRCTNLLNAFLPQKASDGIQRFSTMFVATFRTFLGRQCLEAAILGAMLLIVMLIFRIPYPVTISCMTALLALIPYVGAYLSFFIGAVLVVTVSPMKAVAFIIIFLICQQVEGNVIYPKVVGQSVGLPAYITLAAVMVGGGLAGVVGMFFVIPVVSVLYILLREEVQRRNREGEALKHEGE